MTTSSSSEQNAKAKPSSSKNTSWLIALCAMLLAIAALLMNWQLTQSMKHQTDAFDTDLEQLNEQQTAHEARLEDQYLNTKKAQATWQNKLDALTTSLETTRKEYNNLSDDWRLLKARHLLELAVMNAHWGSDKDTTVAMLREADTILAPIHNPKLIAVREGLAHDITEQLGTQKIDVTALLTRLDAIQARTFHLTVLPLPKDTVPETVPETSTDETAHMHGVIKFVKNLVVIRHNDETLDPKPTLAYEAMLRATVRLNLQEATWAILERNDAVYHIALAQAITNLEHMFSSEATSTQALIGQIKQLDTTQLHADIIMPEQALTALNQLLKAPAEPEGEHES
ncbi:MAG: uroporphyrinogen-III C-methyltransferase [Legionellaceae bacterium]|nr:uroporphyrinogen-III C-methyltransferase [Legionellaceae bacterium]